MPAVKITIDAENMKRLLRGDFITVNLPPRATQLQVHPAKFTINECEEMAKQLNRRSVAEFIGTATRCRKK